MAITTVLFDLDGTLLPMDQELFVKAYFGGLAKKLAPHGYEAKALVDGIWKGTSAMVKNDGTKRNEDAFWDTFTALFGENAKADTPHFDAYYREDFDGVAASCGYSPKAREVIDYLKENGIQTVLATNPIFPAIATEKRMRWAGLSPNDFSYYTTYENSCFCKPNPAYYRDILSHLGLTPEECIMVGNDVEEDMVAATLGMKVFLLTDCLISRNKTDISQYPNGGFDELLVYFKKFFT